jgi:hypothetical protein
MTFMGFTDTGFHRKHADTHLRHAASGRNETMTSSKKGIDQSNINESLCQKGKNF